MLLISVVVLTRCSPTLSRVFSLSTLILLPSFVYIPGLGASVTPGPSVPTRLVRLPPIYPPRRRIFSLRHRRCFHTTFPHPSRQTFMTGHAILGIQENFLEEKTGSPPPLIFITRCSLSQSHRNSNCILLNGDPWLEVGGPRARTGSLVSFFGLLLYQ